MKKASSDDRIQNISTKM